MEREYAIKFTNESAATLAAIQALTQAMQQLHAAGGPAKQAVQGVGAGSGSAASQAGGLADALISVVSASAGLGAARQAISVLSDAMNDAREFATETAREVMKVRDSVRELQAMRGGQKSDEVIRDVMELRAHTGLKQAEAREFLIQFESGAFAARQKGNLGAEGPARDELEKGIKEETALFAVRNGIDPKDAGVLAAAIMTAGPVKSKQDFATKLARSTQGVIEGQGNLTPFARALSRSIAELGDEDSGKVGNPEDVAALLGVASIATGNSPLKASTMLSQGVRELFDFTGPQGEFLQKEIGIKPTDDVMTALDKIHPALAAADASGEGADYFLSQHGFGNERGRRAIAFLSRNLDVAHQRVARNHAGNFGLDASEKNQEFLRTKEGQNRLAEVQADIGEQAPGLENEALERAREAAEGRLRASGGIDTFETNIKDRIGSILSFGSSPGRLRRIDLEARSQLLREAGAVGIDAGARFPGRELDARSPAEGGPLISHGEVVPLQELLNTLGPEIIAKGGNPTGNAEEQLQVLKDISAKLDGRALPPPAQRPPARQAPPANPMRPGS